MTEEEFISNNEITDPSLLLREFFRLFPDLEKDREKISLAWDYLLQKTEGMKRSCGRPYYLHPMRVAAILARNKLDADSIVGGFFHNILGLSGVDIEEIKETGEISELTYTPVPGGIGRVTTAILLRNIIKAAKKG